MKYSLRLALASLVLLGCVCTSFATVVPYDFNSPSSPSSSAQTVPIWQSQDCEGLQTWFQNHPIPIGAIDTGNGGEIAGYEVRCPATVIDQGGDTSGGGPTTTYVRPWGSIKVFYKKP